MVRQKELHMGGNNNRIMKKKKYVIYHTPKRVMLTSFLMLSVILFLSVTGRVLEPYILNDNIVMLSIWGLILFILATYPMWDVLRREE